MIEADGERAGAIGFEVANRRSRIANLGGLAVHPDFRGRRLADEAARMFQRYLIEELGYHRLQLEIYGFNERAMAHAERVGLRARGRAPQGVPAPRRVGRRRALRAVAEDLGNKAAETSS